MNEIILIGDDRVKAIPVMECQEPLIDLCHGHPELHVDLERVDVQKISTSISYIRSSLGPMLILAESYLPKGIHLLIKGCHRPMEVQRGFWDSYYSWLKQKNPNWPEKDIYDECCKLNAPVEVAPHTTGGAVDVTLIDEKGSWLDMGTQFNDSPFETNEATFTNARNISQDAKENRKLLVSAMTKAGFVNYPTEWWHWSYGDKYWALMKGKTHAIYDSISLTHGK